MRPRVLAAVAVAAFRDRVRRPAYLVTILAAVGLGYLAAPPGAGEYAMFKIGAFRGQYDSAYLGVVFALIGALWLGLGGFYVVKNAIARDARSGVGELLAATPMRNGAYLMGKFVGNLLILLTMAGVLAVTALGMQLLRGESTDISLVPLWLPFLLLCVPSLAIAAAGAVLFESVPGLRGGLGNIVWFFVFVYAFAAGWLATGLAGIGDSMRADLLAQHPDTTGTEISVGLTGEDDGLEVFTWSGLEITGALATQQLAQLVVAVLVVLLPAMWFARFDPARTRLPSRLPTRDAAPATAPTAAPTAVLTVAPTVADAAPTPAGPRRLTTRVVRGGTFRRLVAGELRVLLQGHSYWWWLVAAGLTATALVLPDRDAVGVVLLLSWIWPVLIWSRLGTHPHEHSVEPLLTTAAAGRRRLLAEWTAGGMVALLTGAGPLIRAAVAGDAATLFAMLAGAAFIAASALFLGSLSRTARLFQVLYLVLWYLILNGAAAVDMLGALRSEGQLTGPGPVPVAAVTAVLLTAAAVVREVRHARR